MAPSDQEPDYRFSLANERTFLAWIRTSLALLAGGAVVTQLLPNYGPRPLRYLLGLGLICLAFVMAASSYRRWVSVDRAMRQGRPLPTQVLPLILAVAVSCAILVAFVLIAIN